MYICSTSHVIIIYSLLQIGQINFKDPILLGGKMKIKIISNKNFSLTKKLIQY